MIRHAASRLFLVLLTVATLPAAGAKAEVVVRKSITYFTVKGATAEQLDDQLSRHGPKTLASPMRHPGATRIKFGGSVTYAETGHLCRVDKVRVTLSTQLILPRWNRPKSASPGLAMIWNTLAADIKRHEERHAEIARNHARQMEKTFSRLGPERSCKVLQARVAEASRLALADHDSDQARFDRIEAANFESRMERLMRYRMSNRSAQD